MSLDPCSRSVLIACLLSPIRSAAICRVSSAESTVIPGTCTGIICPYTWTCGGRPGEKIKSLIFSAARSMALSKAGVAIRPLPEKSSRATEIGAIVGAAIRPHTRNRTHHRLEEGYKQLYRAGCEEAKAMKCIVLGNRPIKHRGGLRRPELALSCC